jgi:VanZ family protein
VKLKRTQWLALSYTAFILFVIYIANTGSPWLTLLHNIPYADKLGHFVLMGGLTLVINLAVHCHQFRLGRYHVLTASVVLAILITLEEVSQLFIATRHFDLFDLSADYLGILFFSWLALRWQQMQARRSSAE